MNNELFQKIEEFFISRCITYTNKHLEVWYEYLIKYDNAIEKLELCIKSKDYINLGTVIELCDPKLSPEEEYLERMRQRGREIEKEYDNDKY